MNDSPKEKRLATLVYDPELYEEVTLDESKSPDEALKSKKRRRPILRAIFLCLKVLAVILAVTAIVALFVLNRALHRGGYSEKWQESVNGTSLHNERYGSKPWEVMDVYIPSHFDESKSKCAILFIHGGAWIGGFRAEQAGFAKRAAKDGYLVANMEYMLYNDELKEEKRHYSVSKVLDEIDMALAKLKEIGSQHGYDVERVGLTGHSAGGHLSMLYAYSYKIREGGSPPVEVGFVAPRVGPAEFSARSWNAEKKPDTIAWFASFLSGVSITGEELKNPDARVQKALDSISPVSYISSGVPPTLAAYGQKDMLVPFSQCQTLKHVFTKLRARSVASLESESSFSADSSPIFDLIVFPNSNHMLGNDPDCTLRWQGMFLKYAERFLTVSDASTSAPEDAYRELNELGGGETDPAAELDVEEEDEGVDLLELEEAP